MTENEPFGRGAAMRLSAYLEAERLTLQVFGRRVGVAHSTVHKWATGKLLPVWDKVVAIEAATDGAVTAENFAEIARGADTVPDKAARRPADAPKGVVGPPAVLLHEARACGIDAEAACRDALSRAVGAAKAAKWRDENRAAIEAHTRCVEEHGLPLGKHRMF